MAAKRARGPLIAGAVVAAASGVAVNRVDGPWWQQAVAFAVACVLLVTQGVVARWSSSNPGLQLRSADLEGRPRQLGDLGLGELGVHWSQTATDGYGPYVQRDVDHKLNEAINGGQAVVGISGAALAGRTRTLAEAAKRHLADSWLIWFDMPPGVQLADLVAEARRQARGGPVVLWLENADLALLSQFSDQMLDELPPNFRILMTLDDSFLDNHILPGAAAEVLNAPGVCVRLGLVTAEERKRLASESAYTDILTAHKGEPVLMGRLMVSLDRVTNALVISDEESLSRVALLHAAVDWQRAAVPRALTHSVIEKLYRGGYWQELATLGPAATVSRGRFRQAINQLLSRTPNDGIRLLDETDFGDEAHLRPHPLLPVVADDGERPPGWMISETLWNYLDAVLDASQRLSVGINAGVREDYQHAGRMLAPIDAAIIPPHIMLAIGSDAASAREASTARDWYEKIIARDEPDFTPRAMARLGALEQGLGHTDGALKWLERAVATGHRDASVEAMFDLGVLETKRDRIKQARAWYTKAIASGHTTFAPAAMLNLGLLESKQGRVKEARAWYTKAATSGHTIAPIAMLDLAHLEAGQGRKKQARHWYAKAIASGDSHAAPAAMLSLGGMYEQQGRIGDARDLFARAAASGDSDASPRAMFSLALLDQELARTDEARDLYLKIIASGHTDVAPQSMVNLAAIEKGSDNFGQARDLYLRAVHSGHAYASSVATFNLGVLERELGRIKEARSWYTKAIESGDADYAPKTMFNLGVLDKDQGRMEEARTWFERVIASRHPELMARAQGQLDEMRRHQEDLERAQRFVRHSTSYTEAHHHVPPPSSTEPKPDNHDDSSP